MERAASDRKRREKHFVLAWARRTPGTAGLWTLVFIAVVTACLALFGAPSLATSRLHQPLRSAQPIKFRTHLIVDTTSDESTPGDGLCSLREAITTSNDAGGFTNDCGTGSGFDEITFGVSGTITLGSALPAITQNLIIDGIGQTIALDGAMSFQVLTVNSGATLSLNNLTVQNGSGGLAAFGGGIVNNGMLTLNNCAVIDSFAGFGGAGIYNTGMLTVTNSTISNNGNANTDDGGGINNTGTLIVANSSFSGNHAAAGGGVENAPGGMLTLTNSTFSGNSALGGGGILNESSLTISGSTFSGNSVVGGGAGISNASIGTMTLTNSTISDNTASAEGGGIDNGGAMTIVNSTLSGNSAPSGKGGGLLTSKQAAFKNTIVANSTDGGNCSFSGTFTSDGHNLSDDLTCFFVNTGDVNNMPVGLDPNGLQDNGGPTQTIALLPTSPAVDAVPTSPTNFCTETDGTTPINTDQRGVSRPDPEDGVPGKCDIGAFELVEATPTPTATATVTATSTATPSATATATPSATATATPTRTATATATPTSTATATPTSTATATPTSTATASRTATPTSTPTPVAGKLKVSPKTLKFGSVVLNALPKVKTVTVTNAGKIKKKNHPLPILIEMESVDGMPMPSPFSVTTSHCDDDNLMPGGKGVPKGETTCTIEVQFKPTEAVSYSGTLTIFDNLAPSEMQKVQMTGKGKAAK